MKSVTVQYLPDYQYAQLITADGHAFIADEPIDKGGDGLGPDPYDLLLWALGACTAMTLLMYARRSGLDLADVAVTVEHDRTHAADGESATGRVEVLRRKISVRGNLTEEEQAKLLQIARRCPVHRTLEAPPEVVDSLTVGS